MSWFWLAFEAEGDVRRVQEPLDSRERLGMELVYGLVLQQPLVRRAHLIAGAFPAAR